MIQLPFVHRHSPLAAGAPSLPADMVWVQPGDASRATPTVRAGHWAIRRLLRLFWRVRVEGLEHVPATPAILCPNHLGWTDAFLVLQALPVEPRVYVLAESAGVIRDSFRLQLARRFQIMVPLDRDRPRDALRTMHDVLARGGSLILFPEGHLGEREGDLLPLQPGAAHLSLHTGLPLVPVGLTGTRELWLRRTLTVRFGPLLDPATVPGNTLRTRTQALTAALDTALRALLPGDSAAPRFKPLARWLTNLF
jgi:1-acyl-sn-glycerol-3-phosphate acyltransferase